jgi:hypothetical protein
VIHPVFLHQHDERESKVLSLRSWRPTLLRKANFPNLIYISEVLGEFLKIFEKKRRFFFAEDKERINLTKKKIHYFP